MAGANTLYGAGMLELGMTFSNEQLAIDNDIIEMVKRVVEDGIEVNEDTLGLESIREVEFDQFITHQTTRDNIHNYSSPTLINRKMREDWETSGAKDLAMEAHDHINKELAEYEVTPIDADLLKDMEEVVKKADKGA
ncbi:Trimethylamine:corrinoid methyltransferase MttB1 [Methanonatronarchaeum thermophilum]|uniref:Trimethylamine:corrinoid methyltransferase MttB1 n=1 Tax=Methanonatronarchaeum thermophilum TaxID=1927129 RepID=A0A1Y3GGV7_9EURY|nr:Trimethylamine:corrinoid methyltransferase MttB1 [Methanonatronarchaeum thermophilum]